MDWRDCKLASNWQPLGAQTAKVRKSSKAGRIEGNTREDYYSHSLSSLKGVIK